MNNILVRNISRSTNSKLKKYAKKLRVSRNDLILQILDNFVAGRPGLPYEEIHMKLQYLEEMSDLFYFFDEWKTRNYTEENPYPRPLDIIDLGKRKKGTENEKDPSARATR